MRYHMILEETDGFVDWIQIRRMLNAMTTDELNELQPIRRSLLSRTVRHEERDCRLPVAQSKAGVVNKLDDSYSPDSDTSIPRLHMTKEEKYAMNLFMQPPGWMGRLRDSDDD